MINRAMNRPFLQLCLKRKLISVF